MDIPLLDRTCSPSSNNKGLQCPFRPIACQEGYCFECRIYREWQKETSKTSRRTERRIARPLGFKASEVGKMSSKSNNKGLAEILLGEILRFQRLSIPLTLRELSTISGISSSHLGRIERGNRVPSASTLRKIAEPLGFEVSELLTLAGYLPPSSSGQEKENSNYSSEQLDPYVKRILSQEPVEVQHTIISILSILKTIAQATK